MRKIQILFSLILVALLFTNCQKELSYIGGPDPVVVTPEPITSNLQGNIYDENGQPAAGVSVKVGSATVTTDADGYFRISNASLDKKTALVTAEKGGYFKAYRTFAATDGTNHIEIKLIKRSIAGTVAAATGGDVTLSNGSKITFQPNGVVVASSNAPYTGTINVYAAYIDPTSDDIDQIVPGSFMGTNKEGNRVLLTSYGMLSVELEGNAGEKLQIKTGSTATISAPIPSSLLSSAPASIPLWYVDEQTGIWKEEGVATKQGNMYVGEVKHFTYWNYDSQLPGIVLTMTVKDANGNPVVHAKVRVVRANATTSGGGHGFTDTLGVASGLVTANQPLILQIKDACHNTVYTQNIGPFSQATNLGVITISNTAPSQLIIKGKLLTCNSTPVVKGFAIIKIGNKTRYAKTDSLGNFQLAMLHCGNTSTAQILGVDAIANQQGSVQMVTITQPTTNTGNITACGTSANEYINYTLDGTSYAILSVNPTDTLFGKTSPTVNSTNFGTAISGMKWASSVINRFHIEFGSPNQVPGTYAVGGLRVQNFQQGNTLIAPFNVTITTFPTSVGGFYEGNLSGQFKDAQNVTHNITANFRVRRI